ncbi:class I SAM-dependent methyltransferase [Methanolobus vulcani]|uniref:Class I SAM-dependent methyltransferase n=1 Tax=Methanolobus vulcani TaxID=38026 RepID=A0A7Z8KLC6_9EURY|nr:class I SAM-dependent methyltransferase [Methanolobus vulcani]TQD23400.1 class I SAM-dependent methyltransferase [Methanolobus vulcani]
MQKEDNINNLISCWNKVPGIIAMDEDTMAEVWNKRSKNYAKNNGKGDGKKKTEEILVFLDECGFNPEGAKVLDIGCGPGTLSLPLARLGAEVTSLDISSGMLDRLKDVVKKESLPIEVLEYSWWTADIDELGFRKEFDLVIASMTPGIKNVEDFDKMVACSKRLCYYSNFLQRSEDKAYYDIQTSILDENPKVNMNGIVYPFMYLYLSGHRPSLRINHSEWKEEVSWEEAADRAIDFIGRGRSFDDETKGRIMNYYQTASQNGMYSSKSDAYIGMMIWEV